MAPPKPDVANPNYKPLPPSPTGYNTFESFYPFYLGEHSHPVCRRLHLIGTLVSSGILARISLSLLPAAVDRLGVAAAASQYHLDRLQLGAPLWKYVAAALGVSYGLAWTGHAFFERNKPATFTHPVYSLMGDLRMLSEVLTMKRKA